MLASITVLAGSFPAYAEKLTVKWHIIHWPPYMVIEGNEIKGQFGEFLTFMQKKLPQFEHKNTDMTWVRYWTDVKKGSNVYSMMTYKNPEREKVIAYTVPSSIWFNNAIIMKKMLLEKLMS